MISDILKLIKTLFATSTHVVEKNLIVSLSQVLLSVCKFIMADAEGGQDRESGKSIVDTVHTIYFC